MMKYTNQYTDLEHLELVAQRIVESGCNITAQYNDWVNSTFACASLGEQALEPYLSICSTYPGYKREECCQKFDNCLKTGNGSITIGTLMKMAQNAGIDTSLPRGRRQKSAKQQEQEQENRMQQMREMLKAHTEWRFNVWHQRPELRENNGDWRPVQDRDLDTYYCRLREQGVNVKLQDVKSIIFSRDFCDDFDACKSWLYGLKPWNPDTDVDYLHDFYVGHLEFGDPENEDFYDLMFKRWHVAMVGLMLERITENPQMPIFKGPQHIGKSFFARHILPPKLSIYRLEVSPSDRIDKDLVISLSESPFIMFDEISFGSNTKSEAFKYVVTSNRSYVRDAYARFRESRERRASLVATTNENNFIREVEGSRRYLVVDLKGTVDLDAFPLPYEGAYAQALYLLEHGFQPKPTQEESQRITTHNERFMESNDCEEAIRTFLKKPDGTEKAITMSAGDIMRELNFIGFRGREFSTNQIGKVMTKLGFEKKAFNGCRKYYVVKITIDAHSRSNEDDAKEFIPDVF